MSFDVRASVRACMAIYEPVGMPAWPACPAFPAWPGLPVLPACLQVCLHDSICFNINMHANARASLHSFLACLACLVWPGMAYLAACKCDCIRVFVLTSTCMPTHEPNCMPAWPAWPGLICPACLPACKYACMKAFVLFRFSLKTPLTGSDIA